MKFRSDTDIFFDVFIFGPVLILLIPLSEIIININDSSAILSLIVILAVIAFFVWVRFGTYYVIKESQLLYRSGPIRGSIDIQSVHTLIKNKTLWVGTKPALARKGIILKYNKYDDIYISPKNKDQFIAELLKRNNNIQVEES
ncbi:PH (Pleckstrin Homology) domain-containing protein [Arcticibacter tournemirensis]|uniref:PH domain-containing protein n=1 Tax=Arcticibacter tournemirensis TaxID=699437 RepID=A0A5M9HG01_9SPHI|nr:PH domain-containing protein [Arcticibacter tournemirensis]KAA8485409.1 PH domain-containing protein [Arcticibacter tournemirensis]TQM50295.1 PH (Pleckstrin Homology) domain-containing protein [Arcticibacter tournemirensis]